MNKLELPSLTFPELASLMFVPDSLARRQSAQTDHGTFHLQVRDGGPITFFASTSELSSARN